MQCEGVIGGLENSAIMSGTQSGRNYAAGHCSGTKESEMSIVGPIDFAIGIMTWEEECQHTTRFCIGYR